MLACFVLALFAVSHTLDLEAHMSIEGMRRLVADWEPYGPLAFAGICIAGIFLHLPEIVLIGIGGILFGKLWGFVYGWGAALIGATATFLLVRTFAGTTFREALPRRFKALSRLDDHLARDGFRTILLLRLVFAFSPPLNWAIGATSVRTGPYIAGTAVGTAPAVAMATYFADTISSAGSLTDLITPELALPALLALGLVVGAAFAARRLLSSRPVATPSEP